MRILFLPAPWTAALCLGGWLLFQLAAALLCRKLPRGWLSPDRWLFRERGWEKGGRVYKRWFLVHRWKRLLPDIAAALRGGYRKNRLTDFSHGNLDGYLMESCRAELAHILAILTFWLFGFVAPPGAVAWMLLLQLAANLPCVIAQRYNRPRIRAFLERVEFRERNKSIAYE